LVDRTAHLFDQQQHHQQQPTVRRSADPHNPRPGDAPTTIRREMTGDPAPDPAPTPTSATNNSSNNNKNDHSIDLNVIIDRVVEALEQRVIDELDRRGR